MNLVDIDDVAGLERAINELQRVYEIRKIDPNLRADLERTIDAALSAGTITNEDATRMRKELDEVAPAAMLEANFRDLVPNRPALGSFKGAFPRSSHGLPDEWLKQDPRRLANVVREMARFTDNRRLIVEGALALAERVGIDDDIADKVVCGALRAVSQERQHVG